MSDTVGFIQKLPTQLVAAFRATLEEIAEAQMLVHVVDVSHPNAAAQSEAVMQASPARLFTAARACVVPFDSTVEQSIVECVFEPTDRHHCI